VALGVYYVGAVVVTHFHKLAGAGAVALGLIVFCRQVGRLLAHTLVRSWRELNDDARTIQAEEPSDHVDYRPVVVLVTTAVTLTLIEYYGDRDTFRLLVNRWAPTFTTHRYYDLCAFGYWTGSRVMGYVILPWITVLAMPGERLRDYGLRVTGFLKHLWIYVVLYLIVLLPVVMVSFTRDFQNIYPFYKLAARSWTDFFAWEALYGLQFFALEVFFRGYMIHPLKRSMGAYAIFAMAVPYCMIHYNKHIAEVLGAVAAGIVLGTLSLQTGSIWCGVLVHVSVALTMDGLSLVQTAGYPGNPRLVL
jgi:membrane protease YdiL (CAAX protease family)